MTKKKPVKKRKVAAKKVKAKQLKLTPSVKRLLLPAVSDSAARALRQRHLRRRRLAIGLTIIVVLVGLGSGASWQLSRSGSLGQLSLVGIPITKSQTNQSLEQQLQQKIGEYQVTVHKPGGSRSQYTFDQLGISVNVPEAISAAQSTKQQGPLLKRLAWWHHDTTPLKVSVDQAKLQQFIDDHATIVTEPFTNASLAIAGGQTSVTPEHDGRAYLAVAASQKIVDSARSLMSVELKLEEHPIKAKISDQVVSALKNRIDAMLTQKVVLGIHNKEFVAEPADIGEWIDLPDFATAKSADIEVNSGKILAYIDQLAAPYVQQARSEVVMKDPDGQNIVLVKGQSGIDIVDKKTVAVAIAQNVSAAKGFAQDLTIDSAPYEVISAENYDKWIVVDITNKRMYAYAGSTLIRSFRISAGAPKTPTVIGQFTIQTKLRRQDMHGLNADGSTYFQANVEWINYFYGSYAIHGNYWRPSTWFGNVNSSHGCIGIMNDDAEWLYNWAPVGTPVITHL